MTEVQQNIDAATTASDNATASKRKRSRPKKPTQLGGKNTVLNILDDRFVCTYSGKVVDKAVFVPGSTNVCFANIPCGCAWLIDYSGLTGDELQAKLVSFCEAYGQFLDTVRRAPPREQLADFGGNLTYDQWISDLRTWDLITQQQGTTVDVYRKSTTKRATNKKAAASSKVTLKQGMYVIGVESGEKAVRAVTALDSATEKPKGALTPVGAYKRLGKFAAAQDKVQRGHKGVLSIQDKYVVHYLVGDPDDPARNKIVSTLTNDFAVGPAVVIVHKQVTIE